jgi:hypothetical protein
MPLLDDLERSDAVGAPGEEVYGNVQRRGVSHEVDATGQGREPIAWAMPRWYLPRR